MYARTRLSNRMLPAVASTRWPLARSPYSYICSVIVLRELYMWGKYRIHTRRIAASDMTRLLHSFFDLPRGICLSCIEDGF